MKHLVNLVFEYGICEFGTHEADSPARVALELDDLVGGVDDLVVQFAPVLRVAFRLLARCRAHVSQSGASDVDAAPHRHTRVAVLADDVAVTNTNTYETIYLQRSGTSLVLAVHSKHK